MVKTDTTHLHVTNTEIRVNASFGLVKWKVPALPVHQEQIHTYLSPCQAGHKLHHTGHTINTCRSALLYNSVELFLLSKQWV